MMDEYAAKNKSRAKVFVSLGHLRYFSVIKQVDALLGNSSSGIIEAPILKTATINIGDRQKGRLKTESIIDCLPKNQPSKRLCCWLFPGSSKTKCGRQKILITAAMLPEIS
jgi:UDP-N-acetylglucosamine 2-epimerase